MSFTVFPDLPLDLRDMIWSFAARNNGQGRFIQAKFEGTPYYQRTTTRLQTQRRPERASIRHTFRLFELDRPLSTLLVSFESRAATLRENPNYLQLNRGHKIYFNAARDTIHFDLLDMYYINKYCSNSIQRSGRLNAHGFNEIVNLGTSQDGNFRCLDRLRTWQPAGPLLSSVVNPVTTHKPLPDRVHSIYSMHQALNRSYATLQMSLTNRRQLRVSQRHSWNMMHVAIWCLGAAP